VVYTGLPQRWAALAVKTSVLGNSFLLFFPVASTIFGAFSGLHLPNNELKGTSMDFENFNGRFAESWTELLRFYNWEFAKPRAVRNSPSEDLRRPAVVMGAKAYDVDLSHGGRKNIEKTRREQGG
jgi:hypothetical protein